MQILTITIFSALCLACGAVSTDQVLKVTMYGVSKAPAQAAGDREPDFLSFQLNDVQLLGKSGAGPTDLLIDEEEPKVYRIIDRPQVIFEKAIADLEGESFDGIVLRFAATVEGGDSQASSLSFTMANPDISLNQELLVEKAENLECTIKLNWGNTLTDESLGEPDYNISFD